MLHPTRVAKLSEKVDELFDRDAAMAKDCPESPLPEFLVIGDSQAAVGGFDLPQHDVAALLPIHFISRSLQRLHQLPTRDDGQLCQR